MALDTETTTLPGTALTVEQLLPDVTFTDAATGDKWQPSQLRQRSALALCFLHRDCEPCEQFLADLAERENTIDWADAQVRVVLPESASLPFPVLLDPRGEARARMLGEDGELPTVLVADRYTSVVQSFPAPYHDFPDVAGVVKTLFLLACDCE